MGKENPGAVRWMCRSPHDTAAGEFRTPKAVCSVDSSGPENPKTSARMQLKYAVVVVEFLAA